MSTVSARTLVVGTTLALAIAWFTTPSAQPVRTYVNPRSPSDAAALPFSGAVLAGDTLYLSGTLGLVNGQRPDTVEEEARNALTNIQNQLTEAGMSMDDLVSVQVFCADVADYDAFNTVYRTFFTREFPARAFVGSGRLLNNARFEVQGIAVRR